MSPELVARRRLIGVPVAGVLSALIVVIGLLTVRPRAWWAPDRSSSRAVFDFGHGHPALTTAAEWVGHLTVPTVLRVVSLLFAVLLWWRGRRAPGVWWVLTMVVGGAIAIGVRELIARPRPHFPGSGPPVEGYTFPSGHAASAALFAGCVLVVAWPYLHRTGRALAAVGATVFVVVVALSRLLLGVHTIGDVTAGVLLGAVIVLSALPLTRIGPGRARSSARSPRRTG